jgi:hypothetical protein
MAFLIAGGTVHPTRGGITIDDRLPLIDAIPPAPVVRDRIGHLLRELRLARRLLTLAEIADEHREIEGTDPAGGRKAAANVH